MTETGLLHEGEYAAIEKRTEAEIEAAVAFAAAGTLEDPADLLTFVTKESVPQEAQGR